MLNPANQPQRIVSLVPSQTELLYDLGLEEKVVGITKFCIHPDAWFRSKTRIGGTKTLDIEKIKLLQPDLVIANKEENVKEQIDTISETTPVWVSDVKDLDDAIDMIRKLGSLTNTSARAEGIIHEIEEVFHQLQAPAAPLRCAYLIWRDPYMVAGGDTFINDMLKRCGLQNVFADRQRYPEMVLAELKNLRCDLVLLSSEPYPFKEKHILEISAALPGVKVMLVDGKLFSWYGSRLILAAQEFKNLIVKF